MELYSASVRELVYSAMEGYNGTVFAYGQTSSGKTFTMMGTPDAHGVIPQAVQDVFNYIKQSEGRREFLLRVSYLEIYNETIRDLLSPETRDLRIHEDKRRGVYVSPLKEEIVTTPAQVMRVISNGERNRSISTTDYNEHSSRSHTLFQMVIESRDPSTAGGSPPPGAAPGSGKTVKISSLNLIDLAGSEKAASNVDRRKEGSYINRSLLTLGTVIGKLTEEKATHIPYRDSKLTRILQSSLSGNARVSVICTISPSSANLDESTNTLKFAARVKQVVTRAHTNHVLDDKALLQKYRKEISELRERLQNTNEQFEVKHQLALMQIKAERDKVQEELHEQHLVVRLIFLL
ncbi:P-loop containing nucleoside triphosphate hydrolase protein [Blastocladiella britannica]|nr:P-loop containing nucleoside triphosphate hydrolase protein [Blastocladiella britannica]